MRSVCLILFGRPRLPHTKEYFHLFRSLLLLKVYIHSMTQSGTAAALVLATFASSVGVERLELIATQLGKSLITWLGSDLASESRREWRREREQEQLEVEPRGGEEEAWEAAQGTMRA